MLKITDLAAGYDGKIAVRLAELSLQPGQSCLISGPSGSGKTTLLYAIAGFSQPLAGTVELQDVDIYGLDEAARDEFRGRQIGIIFQTLHLIKSLSVLHNILLGQYLIGGAQDNDRAVSLLASLGIAELKDRPATALSQGQAQRVAIARALIKQPALLLADEPTASLDDISAAKAIAELKKLALLFGAILIVSSHDRRLRQHFDRVIELGGES